MKAFERTLMIAEKEYALAMNEIAHASAIIESSLELNMQRAELKVLQESGNEMDLLYLYEAAGQDAQNNANQQGFFSKMATAVKNFITKVWNGIQKIFTGKNTEAYDKLMKAQGKIKLSIPDPTEILNNVESGLSAINGKTAGIGLAAAASIGGIMAAIKNFKNRENKEENYIGITATVKIVDKTGVEMEALTAAMVSALTIYDMCKAVDKRMVIEGTHLLKKTGGKSGEFNF